MLNFFTSFSRRKIFVNLFLGFVIISTLSSCSQSRRDLKKFISRMNAGEYNSASAYIYPEDLVQLYFFAHEVKPLSSTAFLELKDSELKSKKDKANRQIIALFQWKNPNEALRHYFQSINRPLDEDGYFSDTIFIKETVNGDKLTFNWGVPNVENTKLMTASIRNKEIESVAILAYPKMGASKNAVLSKGKRCVFDVEKSKAEWLYCFYMDKSGEVKAGYVDHNLVDRSASTFFHLSIFDSMGLLLAAIIAVIILFPIWWARSLFTSGGGAIFGLLLVLVCLYVLYMCIEKILFELFIINLPYGMT